MRTHMGAIRKAYSSSADLYCVCGHCRPPSALHDLALSGDAKGLSAFLATEEGKRSSLDEPDAFGFTPLQLATDRGGSVTINGC